MFIQSTEIINNSKHKKNIYATVSYVWSQRYETKIEQFYSTTRECIDRAIGKPFDGFIWLDRVPNYDNGIRNDLAINLMAKIYSHARYTVALIPELKRIHIYETMYDNKDVLIDFLNEVIKTIGNSEWFQRAWVFQEQLVSQKIITTINSQTYDITGVVRYILTKDYSAIHREDCYKGLAYDVNNMIKELWNDKQKRYNHEIILLYMFKNIEDQFIKMDMAKDFDHLQARALKKEISLPDALQLTRNRIAGTSCVGYEPIAGISDLSNLQSTLRYIDLTALHLNETRRSEYGKCWLPMRLQTSLVRGITSSIVLGMNKDVVHIMATDISAAAISETEILWRAFDTNEECNVFILITGIVYDKAGKDSIESTILDAKGHCKRIMVVYEGDYNCIEEIRQLTSRRIKWPFTIPIKIALYGVKKQVVF